MKIALTYPEYWPKVRRGAQRQIYELAQFLVKRGHEVQIISSQSEGREIALEGSLQRVVHRHRAFPRLGPWVRKIIPDLNRDFSFIPQVFFTLRKGNFDIVHAWHQMDGYAAYLYHKFYKTNYIFSPTSPPLVEDMKAMPANYYIFRKAAAGAKVVISPSHWQKETLEKDYGIKSEVLLPGLYLSNYSLTKKDVARPKILYTSAIFDPRKGASLLIRAFAQVKKEIPEAILQFAHEVEPEIKEKLLGLVDPKIHSSVEFLGAGSIEELFRFYAEASVSVLPSVRESFGVVVLESLASGTPVVASRHGALPEIIAEDGIGALFEPQNVEDLCHALLKAVNLGQQPETSLKCREHAQKYDWELKGPAYEKLYEEIAKK